LGKLTIVDHQVVQLELFGWEHWANGINLGKVELKEEEGFKKHDQVKITITIETVPYVGVKI